MLHGRVFSLLWFNLYYSWLGIIYLLWLLQVERTRYTKYRSCIDTIGRRYESNCVKKYLAKKLYTRYGYKILIFIQFNIDHRLKKITQSEVCVCPPRFAITETTYCCVKSITVRHSLWNPSYICCSVFDCIGRWQSCPLCFSNVSGINLEECGSVFVSCLHNTFK